MSHYTEPTLKYLCGCVTLIYLELLRIYLFHKSHNAPVEYPTMNHFVTHLCTFLLQNGALWGSCLMHHDDVIKWKHFRRYWPFVWGIHRSPVNSPHKGQWRGVCCSFDLRLNKRLSKQSWGWWFETLSRPLWRHCDDCVIFKMDLLLLIHLAHSICLPGLNATSSEQLRHSGLHLLSIWHLTLICRTYDINSSTNILYR